jgi:predicted aspartyl protease
MIAMRWCFSALAAATISSLLLGASTCAQALASGAAPKFAAEVPLLDCDGTPCIEARIGEDKALKLAIDTGNTDSLLDKAVADEVGLKPTKTMPAGAPAGLFQTTIPAVHIGSVTLREVRALSLALSDMISQKQMPDVAGTLAYTAFKDRVLQIDFVAHKVRISEVLAKSGECAGECDKLSLITFGKKGPQVVVAQGFAINGKAVAAQVDTMYTGTMVVYSTAIDKLGLTDAAKTNKTENFPFTDGGVDMKPAPAQAESFRGEALGVSAPIVYFPTPDVHEPDGLFDATVGLGLFYGSVLTLDFRDMTISVAKVLK